MTDSDGGSTEFVFRLPRSTRDPSLHEHDDPDDAQAHLHVLVVDDDRDNAELLAELLNRAGHSVAIAYDGRGAIAAAELRAPDIAILDIAMPGLDGYEVAQHLRAIAGDRKQRYIALTGHRDRERSALAGFDAHFVKPIGPADLRQILALAE